MTSCNVTTRMLARGAASNHENLSSLFGGLLGNHYHFAQVDTVAEAETLTLGSENVVLFVTEQQTFYRWVAVSTMIRDGSGVLNTGTGGTTRWLGWSGRWQVPQYDDVFTQQLIDPRGVTAADIEILTGLPNLSARAFDGGNTTEAVEGALEVLHGYKTGTTIYPHLHWSPSSNNPGDVRWEFEYSIARASGEFSAPIILVAIDTSQGLGPNGRVIQHNVEFPTGILAGDPAITIGDQIHFVVRRVPSNAADTYPDDAFLHTCGIHYQMDSMGSLGRFIK